MVVHPAPASQFLTYGKTGDASGNVVATLSNGVCFLPFFLRDIDPENQERDFG
jgi:hypothetical protein